MDIDQLASARARQINGSGIREVFKLRTKLLAEGKPIVDLTIGQPHFRVPEAVRHAAIAAIESATGNGYTENPGVPALRERLCRHLRADLGWEIDDGLGGGSAAPAGLLVSSGTSGGIILACLAVLDQGDECIIPDPYFVMYPHAVTLAGGKPVLCDTYPDFHMTAERVERLITPRTKMIMFNSPGNPAGTVATETECRELVELCRRRNILLVSDEIYDLFTFDEFRTQRPGRAPAGGPNSAGITDTRITDAGITAAGRVCPSPAREAGAESHVLLVRGFGKTYGVTGWRLGYVAGPRGLIDQMGKLQQYIYVCAPTPLQMGALAALDVDMSAHVHEYQQRRDEVVAALGPVTELATPGGAFYAFPRVPPPLGMTGTQFKDQCVSRGVLVVPGKAFSPRDTHLRISFATSRETLARGLATISDIMSGRG